jgi:glycosyltransferase involved in cell wall biosynthesis
MKQPLLSILTPTIKGREEQLLFLCQKIENQTNRKPVEYVEHLALCDNRARSIGAKRQALVDIARGQYIAFVDDDDDVSEDYVSQLLTAIESNADVVTFQQRAIYNGLESTVSFRLGQGDGAFTPGGITKRDAWHVCAWKRDVVDGCQFLETNYGEDLAWCVQARKRARTELHIPQILHTYRHDAATTAAPEG